jgi:rhodanese-related sulfurtransferase
VDCRSEEQRQEGKIPKSVHVPLDTMLESNRENLSIQFSKLTVLVYDQDGSTVDQAATFLRDCGAESWSLEGGAESFKDFVTHTRNGTYTRRVTLEEARQHIYAQARAGAKLPRPYDANRALEHFDTRLDEIDPEESESGEKDKAIKSQPHQHPQTTQSAQSAVKKQQVDV